MSRYADITELIAEQAADPTEQKALEAVARKVARELERPVPYRPEFRDALREELMRTARRRLRPWYRRPAVVGPGLAAVAAAVALAVGLQFAQPPAGQGPGQVAQHEPAPSVVPTPSTEPSPPGAQGGADTPYLVALPADLPEVRLADERTTEESLLAPATSPVIASVQLMRLTARPGEAEFRTMAARLGFRGESRRTDRGWVVADEDRTLTMTMDGTVQYADLTEPDADAPRVDEQAAGQAAQRFLDQAALPVHSQPDITPREDGFMVVYTEHVEGRPVVNARTEIAVNQAGTVVRAKAYVPSGVTIQATYTEFVSEREAVEMAESRGGSFRRAELVWVRSVGDGTVYLQPAWRVLGTNAQGTPVARYVAALSQQDGAGE
ncbi:hypothetical protein [Symbiobacterium thermophilum]|uniref:Uncharacterized protein n=1 Tax=Symbiobacterium thermophilum TaxID=2734 RepID=A0A953I6G4_SYMTR|nr:hypothetical protein [Symbiobacterium thermophilum]MBY6274829.1 hypothetical protein [Symbiobacterium thermophilum]